jgi:phosphoribosyl-AMP cyclohydrolase
MDANKAIAHDKNELNKSDDVEEMTVPEMVDALHHGAEDDEIDMLDQALACYNDSEDMTKGDYPGHPFRGNQYAGGSGDGRSSKASHSAHQASKGTMGKGSSRKSHNSASASHQKAANAAKKEGRSNTAAYHQKMADYHSSRANRFKKGEESGDIQKFDGIDIDDAIAKAVSPLQSKIDELHKMIDKLPTQPKGVLRTIGKTEDGVSREAASDPVEIRKADGTLDNEAMAREAIKKVFQTGGRPLGR